MPFKFATNLMTLLLLCACHSLPLPVEHATAKQQVWDAETAFAASMARRDFGDFARFIDDEAIFFNRPQPLRGKTQILAAWQGYFKTAAAPFAWEPTMVEVLPSGTLAHSSGPVRNSQGEPIMMFNSIWRLNNNGQWKVVFDKGSPLPVRQ